MNYDETYSTVVRHSSRFTTIIVRLRSRLQSPQVDPMDAIPAFLQEDLEEEIEMEQELEYLIKALYDMLIFFNNVVLNNSEELR